LGGVLGTAASETDSILRISEEEIVNVPYWVESFTFLSS